MKLRGSSPLRALGASMLAALALVVFTASSAHALGNGLFLINLQTITSFPQSVGGHVQATGLLLITKDFNIQCSLSQLTGDITTLTHGKGFAFFQECVVLGSEVCLVEGSTIVTKLLLAELLLLGKVVRLKPLTGLALALIELLSHEEECSLFVGHKTTLEVLGEACAEVVENDKLKLLLQTDLNAKHCQTHRISVGANPAELHGPAVLVKQGAQKVTTHA